MTTTTKMDANVVTLNIPCRFHQLSHRKQLEIIYLINIIASCGSADIPIIEILQSAGKQVDAEMRKWLNEHDVEKEE